MADTLKIDQSDQILTLTLNRPDRFNAFNDDLHKELKDAFKKARKDDDIRVVVLTGEGKAFSSGQDLKDISDKEDRSLADSLHKRYNPLIKSIRKLPKPVICQLNGVAAGAGCSLALACDLIIASEKAKMVEVFINVGLVLDSGSSYFLPRLVGYHKAFELATQGNQISAEEARELGIVNEIVKPDKLEETVQEMAEYYANAPTKAVGLIKKQLNKSSTSDLETMLEYEAYLQEIAGNTEDYKEGVSAFVEKREPKFKGK